jgi:very-short-patch-repair endonuclease
VVNAPHHRSVAEKQRRNARALRREMTDAERALWHLLRDRRLGDIKFRRQVPFGPFILDFVCFERKLVLEVDGGQHANRDAMPSAINVSRPKVSDHSILEH